MGLLDAPHAMAGRRPTQAGLRFFVDSLLQLGDAPDETKREIDQAIARAGAHPQDVLGAASELLSGLAGGAGLVVTPERDAPVRHAELVAIGPGQALLILVFEDNQVENRLLQTPPGLAASALTEATNFLNAQFRGKTLTEARVEAAEALTRERAALDQAAAKLIENGWWNGRARILPGRVR